MGWTRRVVDWFRQSEGYWSIAGLLLGVLATKVSWLTAATRYAWAAAALLVAWTLGQRVWRRLSRGHRSRLGRASDGVGAKVYWGVLSTLVGAALPNLGIEENLAPWALGLLGLVLVPGLGIAAWGWWTRHRPRPRWPWQAGRDGNPYPLLTPYGDHRARVFFGREDEADAVLARAQSAQDWKGRFIPVVGRSGLGKSSIVRAGVLPRLNTRAPRPISWLVGFLGGARVLGPVTPGDRPVETLATLFADGDAEVAEAIEAEAQQLADAARPGEPGPLPTELLGTLTKLRGWRPRLVVVIDQMEEAAKPGEAGEAQLLAYLTLLKAALIGDSKTVVIATVRADLLGRLLGGPAADLFEDPVIVRPMDRAQLLRVIHGPADVARIRLEDKLDTKMLNDTAGDDALALLGFVLHQLWNAEAPYLADGRLRLVEYDHVGGAKALSHHADAAMDRLIAGRLNDLAPQQARVLVLDTLLEAVNHDGHAATRRRFPAGGLTPRQLDVVGELADPAVGVLVRGELVEISHEVVLRRWDTFANHIEANSEALVLRSRLEPLAKDWDRRDRDPGLLLHGDELHDAQRFTLLQQGLLREFLAASSAADTDQNERFADAAANQALLEVGRDPERAMRMARAAANHAHTTRVHTALYRACRAGHRGRLGHWEHLTGFHWPVTAMAWSPTGTCLATASNDQVWLWSAQGAVLAELTGQTGGVAAVAWSPDGTCLATAGGHQGSVRLWSAEGTALAQLAGHTREVRALAWSPDGSKLASASYEPTIRLWSAEGHALAELTGHTESVSDVAWSPDGNRLASASTDDTIRLWSADGVALAEVIGHTDWVTAVDWSPDGTRLASASNDRTVRLWSADGDAVAELTGHTITVGTLAWSPDGTRLASASYDHTVRLWSAQGNALAKLTGHTDGVEALAWSPDGNRLASAGYDDTVRLWSADGAALAELSGHTDTVVAVAWSPSGDRLASASQDGTVRLWSGAAATRAELTGHTDQVVEVAWNHDGTRLASGSYDRTVRLWSADGVALADLTDHSDLITAVAWSPDGSRLASASWDRTVRLWSAQGAALATLEGHTSRVVAVAWNPDGTRLASASYDGTARLWTVDGPAVALLEGHTDQVWAVAWSPVGTRLATASADNKVRLWSTDGTALAEMTGHTGPVAVVAWSPDGTRLASGSWDDSVRLWSAQGHALAELTGHTRRVDAVVWSQDGTRLASDSYDGTVRLWSAEGDALAELTGHTHEEEALPWGLDGAFLDTASYDGAVRPWTADGSALAELVDYGFFARRAWSADRGLLATAGSDGTVRLWPGPYGFDDLLALVDSIPGLGEITDEERRLASLPTASSTGTVRR